MFKHAVRLITSTGIWASAAMAFGLVALYQGWSATEISTERFLNLTMTWILLSVVLFTLGWIFVKDWPNPTFGEELRSTWGNKEEDKHGK